MIFAFVACIMLFNEFYTRVLSFTPLRLDTRPSRCARLCVGESDDPELDQAIDSFLRGEYFSRFSDDSPKPNPDWDHVETLDAALRALRKTDEPEPDHGAAVFLQFCFPLSRAERWGHVAPGQRDRWKEVLRGALTPGMFTRRLGATEFADMLYWDELDVKSIQSTENYSGQIAFAEAILGFETDTSDNVTASLKCRMRKGNGCWLIETASMPENIPSYTRS